MRLSISIVTFRSDQAVLGRTLDSLARALQAVGADGQVELAELFLVENSATLSETVARASAAMQHALPEMRVHVLHGQGNVGYGRGHNLAIERCASDYHLVLNPDVLLEQEVFSEALAFFDRYPDVGLLSPAIRDRDGTLQYLCRRFPTVFDLLLRGFAPHAIRARFACRIARYEMRDRIGPVESVFDPPIVSGCFMLFRTAVLQEVGGFDPRYFLYFEDYDLSLRLAERTRIAYVPQVRIVHFGGGAARKGWLHIRLFAASAWRFYGRFGWNWF